MTAELSPQKYRWQVYTYVEVMFTRPVELTCSPVHAISLATLSELARALF